MTALRRATYESRYGVQFVAGQLGAGKDGIVLMHRQSTAVEFFYSSDNYTRELRAYRALHAANVDQVLGLHVPQLIQQDHDLLAIEITVVTPPFLLDFASAYTDEELVWRGSPPRFGPSAKLTGPRFSATAGLTPPPSVIRFAKSPD